MMEKPFKNTLNMKKLVDLLKSRKGSRVEDFLVIGIDFGTTFSSAAWATIDDFEADQINMVISWPGYGREEDEVPTAIYYDESGEIKWGYDIPAGAAPLQLSKLLFLRSEDLPEDVQQSNGLPTAKRMLEQSGESTVDVIADYLHALWEHIINTIRKDRGDVVADIMHRHVVLTVPVTWKSYTRQAMRQAAKKAGIMDSRSSSGPTTLSFATESEAAAMATMCEYGSSLSNDDIYILCDAGSRTVDLVNYQITNSEVLELREIGIGKSGLYGGAFIDEAFRVMCEDRLGRQWNKLSNKGIKEIMTKEWEIGIKPQSKPGNTEKQYIVSIPAEAMAKSGLNDPQKGIKNGRLHFSSQDIEQAFAKVFSSIEGLIDDQILKARKAHLPVTGIILVGGLGSSAYLREYLSSKFKSQYIKILQSDKKKSRTAICRGAIFKGFIDGPNSNDDRGFTDVACQSMGAATSYDSTDGFHEEQYKTWHEDQDNHQAANQMHWLIEEHNLNAQRRASVRFSPERATQNAESSRRDAQASSVSSSIPFTIAGSRYSSVFHADSNASESRPSAQYHIASLGDTSSIDHFSTSTIDATPSFDDSASDDLFSLLTLDEDAEQQIAEEINKADTFLEQGSFAKAYPRYQVALALMSKSAASMPPSFHCHAHMGIVECRISASDDKTTENALEYLRSARRHALKAIAITDEASRPWARMALLVTTFKKSEMEAGPDGMDLRQITIFSAKVVKQIEVLQELIGREAGIAQWSGYKRLLTRGEEWRERLAQLGPD